MNYEILDGETVINTIIASQEFVEENYPGNYRLLPDVPVVAPVDPTEWLIDIGSFFDRFGSSKIPALSNDNPTVRAIIQDCRSRNWIDLKREDVAQAIDVMIAAGISGVDAALKDKVINTPVLPYENLALRKLFFGG